MVKSNMLLPVVCVVLLVHIVTSLVFQIRLLSQKTNTTSKVRRRQTIVTIVLLVLAGLCSAVCCFSKVKNGVMNAVCLVNALILLQLGVNSLINPEVETDSGPVGEARNTVFIITAVVNALLAVCCCCK